MCDAGEKASLTMYREFMEEALNDETKSQNEKENIRRRLKRLFANGEEVLFCFVFSLLLLLFFYSIKSYFKRFFMAMLMIQETQIMHGLKQLCIIFMTRTAWALKELNFKRVTMPPMHNGQMLARNWNSMPIIKNFYIRLY